MTAIFPQRAILPLVSKLQLGHALVGEALLRAVWLDRARSLRCRPVEAELPRQGHDQAGAWSRGDGLEALAGPASLLVPKVSAALWARSSRRDSVSPPAHHHLERAPHCHPPTTETEFRLTHPLPKRSANFGKERETGVLAAGPGAGLETAGRGVGVGWPLECGIGLAREPSVGGFIVPGK